MRQCVQKIKTEVDTFTCSQNHEKFPKNERNEYKTQPKQRLRITQNTNRCYSYVKYN